MPDNTTPSLSASAGEDLFNYAVGREDIKWLLDSVFRAEGTEANTVEYELQLLKIISVGWAIAYYLEDTPLRTEMLTAYWGFVREFSATLSESAGLFTGQDINYFELVKQRLDTYLQAMGQAEHGTEPVQVIGPVFGELCGNAEDPFASLVGSKLFTHALAQVHEYLTASELKGSSPSPQA